MTGRPLRPDAIALFAGAALLLAVTALATPAALPTAAIGIGAIAASLLAARALASVFDRRRANQFNRRVGALLRAPLNAPTTPSPDLYALPWFAVLSGDGPPAPVITAAPNAILFRIGPRTTQPPADAANPDLLTLLRTLRPRAPIAGAILALPADRILTDTPAQAQQSAAALASALDALQCAVRTRFPVSIAITHARSLRGFDQLSDAIRPRESQLLGWSNPAPPDSPTPLGSFEHPIAHICADLRRARLEILTDAAPSAPPLVRADSLFALPERVARLAAPLRAYARAIAAIHLKDSRPRFSLRGLYLASQPSSLADLLAHKLIPERRLVCPAARPAQPQRHLPAVAAAALCGPILALALALLPSAVSPHRSSPALARATPALAQPLAHKPVPHLMTLPRWASPLRDGSAWATAAATRGLAALRRLNNQFPHLLAATLHDRLAVNARADDLARARPDLALVPLPTLPLTTPSPIAPRFSPAVARMMFDEFPVIAGALPTAERANITISYSRYAADYCRAWSQIADPPITPAAWPDLRTQLAAINPAQTNRDVHAILFAARAALSIVPSELGQDGPVFAARAAITRDCAALDGPWFDDACRRTRDKWAALDPLTARDAIIRLSRARFESEYLEVYAEPDGAKPASRYWSSLIIAALSSIAQTAAPRADADAFIRDTRAFPLSASATCTLSPAALAAMSERAATLIRTGVTTSTPDESLPLSRGGRTDYPRINDQLARLVGENAFDDDARDRWAYRLRAVLTFLDEPQSCRLVLLDPSIEPPIDGALPAAAFLPQFDLTLDQDPPLGPFFTDHAGDANISFKVPGPSLTFRFRTGTGQAPAASITFPKPWNAVSMLHLPGAIIDDSTDPTGCLVKAPLVFIDPDGRRLCYWIGLRFQRPPPVLTLWPSDADWPE